MNMDKTKNAAAFGFSTEASADINVLALQTALDGGGLVVIDIPGVYDLNNTLILDSDTRLICAPGVVFRKTAPYCNVLINRGALTKTYNENITIDGLEISVNGQEAPPSLVYGLRAQLGFFYVKGLTLRNFTCTDGKSYQYLIYVVTWSNLLIENVRLAGDKDGIKLNNGHDALIRNIELATYDDGTSLCGTDFPSTLVEVGDVYNVRYSNVIDRQYKNIFGRTCLILPGSWADYNNGNEYGTGDFCLNDGKLYQVVSDGGFLATSSDAPVHTDGIKTGDDMIPWRYIQPCDFRETNVYNVTFENCIFEKSGNIIAIFMGPDWHYKEFKGVHRPFYPGTERNSSVWGISLNGCTLTGKKPQVLLNVMGNMKDFSVSDCHFNNPRCAMISIDKDSPNEELLASISGCTFMRTDNPPKTLPDYEGCPILLQDIKDTEYLVAIHNGSRVRLSTSGNTYFGSGFDCMDSKGFNGVIGWLDFRHNRGADSLFLDGHAHWPC